MLYIVATPIGNLGDISKRAVETLCSADFIAAEDTRVTRKLLSHYGINTPLLSYHEHNQRKAGELILCRLLRGENGALVTDAGTPLVSDPGEGLVALCVENGVKVLAIPGASAAICALSQSALPSGRFCFEGFLSVNKQSRTKHLDELKNETRTMIFYEAPHKLLNTLRDFSVAFGSSRRITLCREMTKLHEETLYMNLESAIEHFTQNPTRGEFTLIIEGKQPEEEKTVNIDEAVLLAQKAVSQGASIRDAARDTAEATGVPRREIYSRLLISVKTQ